MGAGEGVEARARVLVSAKEERELDELLDMCVPPLRVMPVSCVTVARSPS